MMVEETQHPFQVLRYSPLRHSPLARPVPAPLALSRFLRRALVSACKNRSAAPLTAPCFCRWQRSLFVPLHAGEANVTYRFRPPTFTA